MRPGGGGLPTDRLFTGYVREQASYVGALDFAQARYYSPLLGRFLSADTLVQSPSDPQALNRYAYTRNNPLRYVDPSGHCFEPATAALCVGAVFLYAMLASQATLNHTYQSNPQVIEDLMRALSFPTDAGPAPTTNTAGSAASVQQPLVLANPVEPVNGVGIVESFPIGGEAAPLVWSTPLGGSSTVQTAGPWLSKAGIYQFPDAANPGKTYVGQLIPLQK